MRIGEERRWLDVRLFPAGALAIRASRENQVMARARALKPSIMGIVKGEFIGQICDQQVG